MPPSDDDFASLLAEHGEWLWRLAASMGMDDEDGRQAARLALLIASRTWDPTRGPFRNWVFIQARSELQRVSRTIGHEPSIPRSIGEIDGGESDLETRGTLLWMLARIDIRSEFVLVGHLCFGYMFKEIGAMIGVSPQRVFTIKEHAIAKAQTSRHVSPPPLDT